MEVPNFSKLDTRYMKRIFRNPSQGLKTRQYSMSWFFDALARGLTHEEAYQEVVASLEEMRKPREIRA